MRSEFVASLTAIRLVPIGRRTELAHRRWFGVVPLMNMIRLRQQSEIGHPDAIDSVRKHVAELDLPG